MYGVETKNNFSLLSEPRKQPPAKKPTAPKEEAVAPAKSGGAGRSAARTSNRGGDKAATGGRPDRNRGPKGSKPREGKRTYDRRSGTGRPKNETKKDNYGKGNWGKAGSEAEVEAEAPEVEEKPEAELTAEELEERAAREREAKYVTLAEFEKKRKQQLAELPALPEARKPNDGDANAWKGFKKVEKANDEEVIAAAFGVVPQKKFKAKKVSKKKAPVRLQAAFAVRDDSRPERPRDNRRENTRRENTRGNKGPSERKGRSGGGKKLAIDDDKSFPTLGGN